jgi:hypothetical protein
MLTKSLGQLEEHAVYILFMASIALFFSHGLWGLTDKLEAHLENRHNINRLHFNVFTIIFVIIIIGLFPRILQRL